jgi:amino acid transporter
MAERGLVPKIFKRCTRNGVPIYCVGVTFLFSLLSLLQLGSGSAKVLTWIINLATGAQLLNYFYMCVTYLCFYRACKAQGIDRNQFVFRAWYQPYLTIFAMIILFLMVFVLGYTVFLPGNWSIENFLTYYIMIFVSIGLFIGHKLIYRERPIRPEDADLVTGIEEVEIHEEQYLASIPRNADGTVKSSWADKINNFLF